MCKIPVIIDCDPGVDDVLAIILGIYHPDIEIQGICSVTGNGDIENTTRNAKDIVAFCNRKDIPIYQGSAVTLDNHKPATVSAFGDDGLGGFAKTIHSDKKIELECAVDYLIKSIHKNPEELTLLIIGPCTNIARAIRKDQTIVSKVKHVVIMGGAKYTGNMSPVAEYNFWADPLAAKEVLMAGFSKLDIIGLDVTNQIALSAETREVMRIFNTPLSNLIYNVTRDGVDENWLARRKAIAPMHDVLTMAYIINPSIVTMKPVNIDVVIEGIAKGQSVVDIGGHWNEGVCNAQFGFGVDVNRFYQLFLTTIFPEKCKDVEVFLEGQVK